MEPGSPEHKVSYVRELVAVGCNKVCGALTWCVLSLAPLASP